MKYIITLSGKQLNNIILKSEDLSEYILEKNVNISSDGVSLFFAFNSQHDWLEFNLKFQ